MRLIILLALSLPAVYASAQSDNPNQFGFQAGANISAMNFNLGSPPPPAHAPVYWKPGISFGFLVRIRLAGKLFLQPEYAFTRRNGEDKALNTEYSFDYLSMPVLLNYRLSPRFALLAGPQLDMLISARSADQGQRSSITHDVEERGISVTGGFEIELVKSLFLSARYLQGLNHIGIGQRSAVKEFKYQAVQLSAGIRF